MKTDNFDLSNNQNKTDSKAISCGNCWGFQEWDGKTWDQQQQRSRLLKDGFILKFIKKLFSK